MKKYAFGVDIGGTTIKFGLFDPAENICETWKIRTRTEENGINILSDIAKSINDKLEQYGISRECVEGIGLGVPGPVDPDGTVRKCINLGWGIFNIENEMEALMKIKVRAGNDANVAALGEMWRGGGRGHENIVMVTLGTGVGGGVVINGRILPGADGAAGEIGHIHMRDDESEMCSCGNYGCLEQYASANGIVRITQKYLANHPEAITSLRKMEYFTSKDIFELAERGDQTALLMADRVGALLGKALAGISCMINPEEFVIGGGMSEAGEILIDSIRENYRRYGFHASQNTAFKRAELSNDAGIYGAVKLVLE